MIVVFSSIGAEWCLLNSISCCAEPAELSPRGAMWFGGEPVSSPPLEQACQEGNALLPLPQPSSCNDAETRCGGKLNDAGKKEMSFVHAVGHLAGYLKHFKKNLIVYTLPAVLPQNTS